MTDQEQSQHWRELAEQLGLPADSEGPPRTTPDTHERPAQSSSPAEPPPSDISDKALSFPEAEEPVDFHRHDESFPAPKTEAPARELSEGYGHSQDPDTQQSARKGGRRRRGNSERRSSQRSDGPEDRSPVDNAGAHKVRSGRGRRGKSRNKDGDSVPAASKAIDATRYETDAEPLSPEDREEVDNLSDWNVPSWTELIDSLYRPDR